MRVSTTPLRVIKNIIRVAERGPLPLRTHDDITTDEQLYDLLLGSMSHDDQKMHHFGLTSIDKIPPG